MSALRARPSKLAAGRARIITVRVSLSGARDRIRFELQRLKHHRWYRLKRLGTRKLRPGAAKLRLQVAPLPKGAFRLAAIGAASSAMAALRVR